LSLSAARFVAALHLLAFFAWFFFALALLVALSFATRLLALAALALLTRVLVGFLLLSLLFHLSLLGWIGDMPRPAQGKRCAHVQP
jgi:hypothetical protein